MPSTCSTPCTTNNASSSSYVPACVGALLAATCGQITTSPSNSGGSPASSRSPLGPVGPLSGHRPAPTTSSSNGNESTSVGSFAPMKRSLSSVIVSSSTNSNESSAS